MNTENGNWLWRLQSSWKYLAHQIAVSRSVYFSIRCKTRCAAENAPPLVYTPFSAMTTRSLIHCTLGNRLA
ncbi:hypothetical protein D3C72_2558750 [compost metagenome]